MDALLILGGLLLVVAGVVWLVVLAFGTGLLWGVGSLFPPVGLLYVFRHWSVARKAVGLSGLGLVPVVVGFSLLASHDPERFAAIASLQWLRPVAHDQRPALQLQGELNGRSFEPQTGVLVDGVLALREGDELFARQEVNVRLGALGSGDVKIDVLPQDAKPSPEIEIAWMYADQRLPEARRIRNGYTLHLDLKRAPPNRLVGDFHLVLPARYRTSLSGQVELYTDGLRYHDGAVDLRHDSVDTLRYLVNEHLQRRFGTRAVRVLELSPVTFPAATLELNVQAAVNGADRHAELQLHKGDRGWQVVDADRYPPLPPEPPAQQSPKTAGLPTEPSAGAAPAASEDLAISLAALLRAPGRFENQSLRAYTKRGGTAEGLFLGLDQDGNLTIRRRLKGAGNATYNLPPEDVVRLERLVP